MRDILHLLFGYDGPMRPFTQAQKVRKKELRRLFDASGVKPMFELIGNLGYEYKKKAGDLENEIYSLNIFKPPLDTWPPAVKALHLEYQDVVEGYYAVYHAFCAMQEPLVNMYIENYKASVSAPINAKTKAFLFDHKNLDTLVIGELLRLLALAERPGPNVKGRA